jgi:C1A family cysteine protease
VKTITANSIERKLNGWRPQKPDHRDFKYTAPEGPVPSKGDVKAHLPRVEDQGQLGSCTAHGTTGAMEFLYRLKGRTQPQLSRLFCYYASRVWIEGTDPHEDSGCEIRDVIKAVAQYGVPTEGLWPYKVEKFARKPSLRATNSALKHQALSYHLVDGVDAMKACLNEGYPVIIGFSVPENMESEECARTGVVKFPAAHEHIVGGHCVLVVGWDDSTQMFTFQNSWGEGWGAAGFGYLPYEFWTKGLADDCWTVRAEEMP